MTNELAVHSQDADLQIPDTVSPEGFEQGLLFAAAKAKILKKIVDEQVLKVTVEGSEYLKVEGWMTIGAGYNYTCGTEIVEFIELRGVTGVKAKATIYKDGVICGHADGICFSDEYGKGNQTISQLAGMAQTRAESRAYKELLSWVVVLAGYEPTPSDEIPEKDGNSFSKTGSGQPWRQGGAPSADRELGEYCETHQANWFKTIKMKGFAHPIEGEKTASGGTIWCNYKPAPPPQPEIIDNLDDLNDIGDEHPA